MFQRATKVLYCCLSLFVVLTVFFGCAKRMSAQQEKDATSTEKGTVSSDSDTQDLGSLIDLSSLYNFIIIDWDEYQTAAEIVNAATNVFTGKVIDISFEIFNVKTGQIDHSSESDEADLLLYTLYTVDVLDNSKGSSSSPLTIKMVGGIESRMEEQKELCREVGVVRPIINGGTTELTIGESYLFCTQRYPLYDAIINMKQFAYPTDSAEAEAIRQACLGLN